MAVYHKMVLIEQGTSDSDNQDLYAATLRMAFVGDQPLAYHTFTTSGGQDRGVSTNEALSLILLALEDGFTVNVEAR